jgi:hypothetical protein
MGEGRINLVGLRSADAVVVTGLPQYDFLVTLDRKLIGWKRRAR